MKKFVVIISAPDSYKEWDLEKTLNLFTWMKDIKVESVKENKVESCLNCPQNINCVLSLFNKIPKDCPMWRNKND